MDDRKSYSAFAGKVRKVTCCQNDKSRNLERSRREDLLNKLKNMRLKYSPDVCNENVCITECSSRKFVKPKKMSYLDRSTNSCSERTMMNMGNPGRVSYKEALLYSRRNEVSNCSIGSTRLSNKVDCNCYDQRQGKHCWRPYFEKFHANKKGPCESRVNWNCTNLSCESLVVNHSPRTNIDNIYNNKKKNPRSFKNRTFKDFSHCQCSSESSCSEDLEKQTRALQKNRIKILDETKRVRDKASEDKIFECCCGDDEKLKANCSFFCRCPGYREHSYSSENSIDFLAKSGQPKNKDSKYKSSNENDYCYTDEERTEYNIRSLNCEKSKSGNSSQNNEDNVQSDFQRNINSTNNIRLQDLTPDLPLPGHWTKCGEHLTTVANEYRLLSDKLKSIQTLAEDKSSNKNTGEKFTRNYSSGKEFTFEVKPAEKASMQKSERSSCECKECPLLSKTWERIRSWGNGKESKILKSYNSLIKSKYLENAFLNKKIDRQCSQGSIKCQETFKLSPTEKTSNQKSKSHSKSLEKKELNLHKMKSYHDRHDFEKKMSKDKKIKNKPECNINFPRIVKPGGESCKVNLKKILVYPPHGEQGPPLTLYKKFSNIDCRIKGDVTKGFRYKVTYKQKFMSPIWHPDNGTSPFRKKKNTTGYG
ncbi:uncharacterized protein LOC117171184 isoform X2 [Belonocnema kinseyi]|uniref:uncharacterized protein LOC117171184 isoform X2 n=1 Tax=Belonocnema kinseyi TaxID=2817044 RepID=UPI00143D6138|nr:uncharacterized protein LOC117171184 isoform X2 [Belonocnema kinseyi]